ncbi:hypothetical protein [Amycolatopsis sp. H20-H5]|uniref:hypothetical protein n=1 Tax=Amycolatopsis sp. H20-H5 TaxID=3046309 RepID=UPI002DBF0D83|nr:hypothetical protein [Amycolatopsis sp. H20-H5]MEC3982407.1 hypothetical protein [Amycolatopsis sp. H20-H5]
MDEPAVDERTGDLAAVDAPVDNPVDDEELPLAEPVAETPEARAKSRLWPALFLVLALLAGGFGTWFYAEARDAGGPMAHNTALVDTTTTAEASKQVSQALATVFSYRYDDQAKSEAVAKDLLTGTALDQYRQLFGEVRKLATEQKLVVTSTAVTTGVKMLDGDRAALLVFLDQTGTRDGGQSSTGAAQLSVTAERTDGRWHITTLASS